MVHGPLRGQFLPSVKQTCNAHPDIQAGFKYTVFGLFGRIRLLQIQGLAVRKQNNIAGSKMFPTHSPSPHVHRASLDSGEWKRRAQTPTETSTRHRETASCMQNATFYCSKKNSNFLQERSFLYIAPLTKPHREGDVICRPIYIPSSLEINGRTDTTDCSTLPANAGGKYPTTRLNMHDNWQQGAKVR